MGKEARRIVAVDPASPGSIHRAVTSLTAGGIVYLAPGAYVVESTITVPSRVALVGAGPDQTTITLAPGSGCHVFTNDDHAKGNQDIELRGFTLEGNMRGQHRPPGVSSTTFALDGCTGNGIMLGSKFSPLSDVVVRAVARRSMRGLSLFGHPDHELSNVCVSGDYSDNRECGLMVFNASNVFILNATIASNATAGIVVEGKSGSHHCVGASCRITGSPKLVVERDGNQVAYVAETIAIATTIGVEPLETPDVTPGPSGPALLARRLHRRLARSLARPATRPLTLCSVRR